MRTYLEAAIAGRTAARPAAARQRQPGIHERGGDLDPETVAELRRLARSWPRSGREAVAKASALRTLERLNRGQRQVPPMPDGWYPHEPGGPFYELGWVFLHEHPAILRRHREMAWREGRA